MNVYLAKFMIYYEIHRMHRADHSISKISEFLALNRRTVSKYLAMSERDYEEFLIKQGSRQRILQPYEEFVRERLEAYRDTPAAQMHDWLKESHPDFPAVSQKTVFNFVSWVREKHRLPLVATERQFQQLPETPYGQQAQVDFGEYNMRTTSGTRAKVFFFTLVLSRSRFKFVWFTDRYFTSEMAIQAHELAFGYIMGIPDEIVYDQDKVFMVSENGGDIILTEAFRSYTRTQGFNLHFCRKADPQSKGKVENVVKYVKRNFLYNRTYHNIQTLNEEAMGWLGRTANALPHGTSQKEPCTELNIERPFLQPHSPYAVPAATASKPYAVRKDNTISYRGNFYSLPLGTYRGKDTRVAIAIRENTLVISGTGDEGEICRHKIPVGKGNKVFNTSHKRDNTAAIGEMMEQVAALFGNPAKAMQWLGMIRTGKPRYIRDQLTTIRKTALQTASPELNAALEYCLTRGIHSAADFKSILAAKQRKPEPKVVRLNPLSGHTHEKANIKPHQSSIADFEAILKKS